MARIITNGCPICKQDVSRFSMHCEDTDHPFELAVALVLDQIPIVDNLPGPSKRSILEKQIAKTPRNPSYLREMARFVVLSASIATKAQNAEHGGEEETMASESYFPISCLCCGRPFDSSASVFHETRESKTHSMPILSSENGVFIIERDCPCGSPVVFKIKQRRNLCAEGVERRQIYENLQERLLEAGVPRISVRSVILMTANRASRIMRGEVF